MKRSVLFLIALTVVSNAALCGFQEREPRHQCVGAANCTITTGPGRLWRIRSSRGKCRS